MKVIYNSIIEEILDVQQVAEMTGRTIKCIELQESEYYEAMREMGMQGTTQPMLGDTICGVPIVILTKELLRKRAEDKLGQDGLI